jgi:hypothetical protein
VSRQRNGASLAAIREGVMPTRPPTRLAPRPPFQALLFLPFLVAADGDDARVRLARAEGALASVEEAAQALSAHTRKIVESGRFEGIAQLHGDALALHRQVSSAELAVAFLAELDAP